MKQTAKRRIERAVEKVAARTSGLTRQEGVTLILAERARLKRRVRKVSAQSQKVGTQNPNYRLGYQVACDDILQLWEA